ncbi:MAG: glycosyltransferase [Nanoarchaeota archaeon]|nr:glycosyltransferase [Nanoarchaeota archaeon]
MIINSPSRGTRLFYILFGLVTLSLIFYYLSNTIIHFTTPRQFPINSFKRFPLTILILPAEIFSFLFALYFVYNLLSDKYVPPAKSYLKGNKDVAILLPVYNEPRYIVERTLKAVKDLRWNGKIKIYVLDDSTDEKDKKNMDELSKKYDTGLIRRTDRIGYKAGNINNAIKNYIKEDYFVIFDSDQAPKAQFLEETMHLFNDMEVGFVQTPQHFINDTTPLQRAAKLGTNIFYRAQCVSKANDGAIPFCGTNVVVRNSLFREIGGFSYYTSTEDIELGIRMNSRGYKGAYVPMILVEGYTPPDLKAYASQQYRWANGNLAILRQSFFKIFGGNFPMRYQMHMFFTIGWWLIGIVTLLYIMVPILSLLFGLGTHHTWLPSVLLFLLFFHVVLGISMIYASLKGRAAGEHVKISDSMLQYSLITNSMFIYAKAALNAIVLKRYIGFVRTQKTATNSGLAHIKWNLVLAGICFILSIYSLYNSLLASDIVQLRSSLPLSLWLLFYSLILTSSILFVLDQKK